MSGIWDWRFRRREKRKLLNALQEKAQQDPQNCQVLVRLGDLLVKMGKKKAAIDAYRQVAEKFAQQGLIIEATAISKVIMRLDPLETEIQQKVSKLYTEWEALNKKEHTSS